MIPAPDTEVRAVMAAQRRLLKVVAATLAFTVATAVVGAVVAARATAATGATDPPRELAFVRGAASATELYVVREDGSGLRRLTRNRVADYAPVWSPDGRRLLFVSSRDGDDELFVLDATGRNARQLTRNRRQDLTPQWSPDGRSIAFASDRARPGEPELWVMRADGGGARRVVRTVDHPGWQDAQYSPTWAPDGRRLIFSMSVAESNPELHVVGVDGRGLRRLTRTRGSIDVFGDDTMPDWSADGKTVVFVSNREQRTSDVWTMRADGRGQRPVLRRPRSDDWNPRLSPDGRAIAFTELPPGGGKSSVWLMNRDGSGARRVTTGAEPDWRPAPTRAAAVTASAPAARAGLIAFHRSTDDGGSSLYVVRADGTGLRKLSKGPLDFDAAWTPDGRRLVFASSRGGRAGAPELYVRDLPGRSVVRLTHTPPTIRNVEPAVSADGERVVFVRTAYRNGEWASDLHSVSLAGGSARQLTRTPGLEATPTLGRSNALYFERGGWIYETALGKTRRVARGVHPAKDPSARGLVAFAFAGAIYVSWGGPPQKVVEGTETGGLSQPAWSPDGERLVYVAPDGLFTVKPDGTDVRRLTRTSARTRDAAPSWQPAPRAAREERIVFDSDGGLYAVDRDGTHLRRLGTGGDAAWSPDGGSLVFARNNPALPPDRDLFVSRRDGSGAHRLAAFDGFESDPAWSPDGSGIAFEGRPVGESRLARAEDVYVVARDGSRLVRLTTQPGFDGDPAFAPDGKRIAFSSERDGNTDVFVMNLDGTAATRLTTTSGDDVHPAWSPDGGKITFESNRDGNREIYVMNADGTNERRLTTASGVDMTPAFSPDGRRIVFASDRGAAASRYGTDLYVVAAAGGPASRLTRLAAAVRAPHWAEVGR